MAIEISATTKALKERTNLQQQIVLKIDGFTECFGAVSVEEVVKIGSEISIGEFTIGGLQEVPGSLDYISLEGTTSQITSQVNIEDGLPNSISRFQIKMIDKDASLSELFRPGNKVDDMLGLEAQVYITFQGASFPEDATRIFIGIIDSIDFPPGEVSLSISSPEKFRQNEAFLKYTDKLDGAIGTGDTTITVDTTANFIEPSDVLQSYIKIEDELMEVSSLTSTTFTVTRGQLGTTAAAASDNAEVESFYRLQGKPIDLALKLMISDGDEFYAEDLTATAFNQISPTENVTNAIFFPTYNNVEDDLGIVEGDFLTVTGADNPANDVTDAVISGFGTSGSGSYIVVNTTLTTDTDQSATVKIRSKYDTLNTGFGINPKFIDIPQFENIASTNPAFFEDYDLYVKDTVDGEDFISSKILFPSGILSTIRKGRTSAVFLAPPVVTNLAPVLDETNIEKPDRIILKRSINENFYSAIVYKFNESVLEDKFLAGEIRQSVESTQRIKVPNKVLTIEAPGLRDTAAARTLLQNVSERLLQRYRFGAESMEVNVNYRDSFNLDLRDAVVFNGTNLSIANTKNGSRNLEAKVFQIFNRSINLKTGEVKLKLVDSIYDTNGRYIVIAPSSLIGSGATTTKLPLKRSFSTSELDEENEKWQRLIGERIRIRSADFTYNEETTFKGFAEGFLNTMDIEAVGLAPSEDYIVEPADYDETSSSVNFLTKAIHGSFNRQVSVVSGISSTQFTVSAPDAAELTEETEIRIHSEDYTLDSGNVEITDITGTTITVEDMGFTPSSTDFVDRIGYTDGGDPYLYL